MITKPLEITRLRGIWMGVTDMSRTRAFYERLGAQFATEGSAEAITTATLGGTRLVFEAVEYTPSRGAGAYLLFDVADANALHAALDEAGVDVVTAPKDEPWGRQFNVLDPDGYPIAFIGPLP